MKMAKTKIKTNKRSIAKKEKSYIEQSAVEQQLREAMSTAGVDAPPSLVGDGKFHRFSTNKNESDTAGFYILHMQGIPTALFGDWRTGSQEFWRADVGRPLSTHEAYKQQELQRQMIERHRREREKVHKEASFVARKTWESAQEVESHPYLRKKGVRAYGLRVGADRRLIVPVYSDFAGSFQSLQFINDKGNKRFLPGGAKRSGYYVIGIPSSATTICLVEGFATGATVHEATGLPVVVAFDCGNLVNVAKEIRAAFPPSLIVVCGDDDFQTPGNPGKKCARSAARAVDGVVALPLFSEEHRKKETDFNDLAQVSGLSAVENIIRHAIRSRQSKSGVTDVTDVAANEQKELRSNTVATSNEPDVSDPDVPEQTDWPTYCVFRNEFQFGSSKYNPGVYWFGFKASKNGSYPCVKYVSTPVYIEAVTRDCHDTNYGRILHFRNSVGRWHRWAMPMELLKGKGEDLRGELFARGVTIHPRAIDNFAEYLLTVEPPAQKICATQTGWHGETFVLPGAVLGRGKNSIVFQDGQRDSHEYQSAGSLEGWQSGIAAQAIANPILALALSVSFAGPLLQKCHAESGGIHLVGDSSTGKTTVIEAAAATWGGPSFKRSWRATANGIEGAATLFNDTLLALDEISECQPREIGHIVYALGNGTGKQRANRFGSARPVHRWRSTVLSSGERGLVTAMEDGGFRTKAGQSIRLLDVAVDRPFGAWDNIGHARDAAAFSEAVRGTSRQHYGYAGPAFLEKLTQDGADFLAEWETLKQLPEFSPLDSDGQEQRAAARFALFALAGELATRYGITQWPSGIATRAAVIAFRAWCADRGRGSDERRQIVDAVASFIERNGDSRFSNVGFRESYVRDRAGWYEENESARTYLFTCDGMREALRGFDFKRSIATLSNLGVLPARNADGELSRPTAVGKRRLRLYSVDYEKLVRQ